MDEATYAKLRRPPNGVTDLSGRDMLVWEQKMGMSVQYFVGTLNPQKALTDEHGNEVVNDEGEVVMVRDLEAVSQFRDNQSTKGMMLAIWLHSRSNCGLPGLRFDDILDLPVARIYEIPADGEEDDDGEGLPVVDPTEPKDGTPSTSAPTTSGSVETTGV